MKSHTFKKLNPCPFCGCKKILLEETTRCFLVAECTECGAQMYSPQSFEMKSRWTIAKQKEEITRLWNRRVVLSKG